MGVVYHTNYLVWFEVGRTEYLRQAGYTYSQLEEEGILLPVVSCEADFKGSAKYDDLVTIETKVCQLTGAKITFEYQITLKDNNKLLTTGKTTHVFLNPKGKLSNIKKTRPDLWTTLNNLADNKE
jgi:acyl-CoA thioester hydrolase